MAGKNQDMWAAGKSQWSKLMDEVVITEIEWKQSNDLAGIMMAEWGKFMKETPDPKSKADWAKSIPVALDLKERSGVKWNSLMAQAVTAKAGWRKLIKEVLVTRDKWLKSIEKGVISKTEWAKMMEDALDLMKNGEWSQQMDWQKFMEEAIQCMEEAAMFMSRHDGAELIEIMEEALDLIVVAKGEREKFMEEAHMAKIKWVKLIKQARMVVAEWAKLIQEAAIAKTEWELLIEEAVKAWSTTRKSTRHNKRKARGLRIGPRHAY